MTGSVMFIRLKNGDDIVSECYECEENTGKYLVLINPLKAMYMSSMTSRGFLQVAFMPWVYNRIVKSQEFTVHSTEVLLLQDVSEYMEEYYWNNIETMYAEKTEEPQESEEKSRIEQIKEALEEAGLDGDLDNIKKVYH